MLEGTWALISGEQDGQLVSDDDLKHSKLEIIGDQHTVTIAGSVLKGTHKLDTSQDPMTIDSADTAGLFEGMSVKGIYKLEGEQFTVCFAAPGEERPTAFTTQDGKATLLHVWKRQA